MSEHCTVAVGARGEATAVAYLARQEYRILERNWHCRFGELDIIAVDPDDTLVIVEVKYRHSEWSGGGLAAVNRRKWRRLRTAAALWLEKHRGNWQVRFDVIDVGPDGIRDHAKGVQL